MAEEFSTEERTIVEHIEPGSFVVDVGSHVGSFARLFLERGYKVLSVEPQQAEISRQGRDLEAYVRAGRLFLENVACSSREGTATLFVGSVTVLSTLEPRWHEKTKPGSSSGRAVEVPTVRLSQLVQRYAQRGLTAQAVKIDAEGHDYQVLLGLFDGLEATLYPRIVMFEFQTHPVEEQPLRDCLSVLAQRGFRQIKFTIRHGARLLHESPWTDRIDDIHAWDGPQREIPRGHRYGNVLARPPR